ncbi:uncharacterized protein LAESUDRAFT_545404 [Laetiporus sulphureus 93-53]|uniref:Uncharacterized protein n=1 Tax=Laetiporus sulphureus 93-53 TaxID=1314785 RepID=A0A165FNT8_9APHY|nr:uncharacterized protein LAESUDRAFT_545404 [Laetiporus sulphureus 93-53]KZT09250.1 hypothetical protein LAESUDRAFT_545404 [Laetiporus sulphureus 93-53]
MMKTRRKSKAAAAAAAEAAAAEASTRDSSPAPAASQDVAFSVTIPNELDTNALVELIPDLNPSSPSPSAIVSLYRLLLSHASENDATRKELEEARAEIERKDVELDQALQDKESATRDLESALESVRAELQTAKSDKEELATSRNALRTQITAISTTQSAASTEVVLLKQKIEDVEREKRDLLTVVSRMEDDSTQRETEIQTLRGSLKQARQDHQELERQLRELKSNETASKFKIETLTQQLTLEQEQAARTSDELAAKVHEFAAYRRDKLGEVAKLQGDRDALAARLQTAESQLETLRTQHADQLRRHERATSELNQVTRQFAEQKESFATETTSLRNLVAKMQEREQATKKIVDEIDRKWNDVNAKAERREAVLREDILEQTQRAEEAEKRAAELDRILHGVEHGEFPMPSFASGGQSFSTPVRGPGTPSMANIGTPDFLSQSMLSPTVAMASRAQKGGKTFTEVYTDYVRLQEEYARKSAEFDNMDRTLSAVLAQIEERAPILSQQRAEYERLQLEASDLASQLAQAIAEREAYASSAHENEQKLRRSSKENSLLQKQLDDLGRQVRRLLKELGRAQDPSIPPDDELEADQSTRPAETIDAVITNNLVLFRSIPQLQEQNQKLLKITRELGAKLESEEREYREFLDKEQSEAIEEAHAAIKQLQEQLESQKKSSEITIQAYMKERDSLRALLARENAQASLAMSGIVHDEQRAVERTDVENELAEVQSQFEAYRSEMSIDSGRLRDEAQAARTEANQLGAALAKAKGEKEMQTKEMESLSNRNQQLLSQYTRIDIECKRVSDDLSTANGTVERLRTESANLRAEKKIWKDVEARLMEENRALALERSHLTDLMANVQKMHNDLDRSGESDRRRLENQVQMLENQTQDLRLQLVQERDSLRHLTLQNNFETKELRARVERSAEELAKTRESLVAAETSKKHLEERVEQLTKQLQANEEKLAVYERRATGANGATTRSDENMTREQQLEAEVAELRSALKVAEVDLAAARSHVQQFQDISQANELALATLNATHDEYKASTEAELARQNSEIEALQEKLRTAQQELAQVTRNNAELQRSLDTERVAWANDRKTLEDTIVEMSTSERAIENDRESREREIGQIEQQAKAAEERYAREVVAHAEALKSVADLREQLAKAQSLVRDHSSAAQTAQARLTASEASWKQQKEALDKEIADLNSRCKDLNAQNSLLHQHLDSVTSQAARIREAAASSAEVAETDSGDEADTKLAELRSVIAYLRREKDIAEMQLELSRQENLRLKTQIDHLTKSLDECHQELSEERERAASAAPSEAQHKELIERVNQLNILRESNATLRADCEASAKRVQELDSKLKELSAQLDPAKEDLSVARAELEAKDRQISRLEDENRKWKERNSQLLSKYDRIDPAEVDSLKEEIVQLKEAITERDGRITAQAERVVALENIVTRHKETGQKNNQKYLARFAQFNAEKAQLQEQIGQLQENLRTITAERDDLKARAGGGATSASSREQELSQQLESLRSDKAALESFLEERDVRVERSSTQIDELNNIIASLREERDKLLAEKVAPGVNAAAVAPESQWQSEKAEIIKARDEALAQVQLAKEQAQKAADEAKNIRLANEKFQVRIQDLSKARVADSEKAAAQQQAAVTAAVEKLRKELQASAPSDEIAARHARELRQLEERLTAVHGDKLRAAVDAAVLKARGETAFSFATPGGGQRAAIETAVEQRLKVQHEQEIASAVDRGRMEQAAKSKLKDQQLVRAQTKLKELEAQILEWRQNGILDEEKITATKAPATAPPPKSAPSSNITGTVASKSLPHKPPVPRSPSGEGSSRGRGAARGGARGAPLAIRGTARGRGGAHVPSPTSTTGESAVAGVSIVGAAAKRGRDEEAGSDDSLAKRLKPGEGLSKPVALRRDRVPPPS